MPTSQPESIIGSPDTFHSLVDGTTVRPVSAVITNNSLLRQGTSITSPVTPIFTGRPILDRSVSSPHLHLSRNFESTRNSPSIPHSIPHNREWMLFGQLMEDGGQLRPTSSTKIRRRNAQHGPIGTSPARSNATDHDPFLVSPEEPEPFPSDSPAVSPDPYDYSSDASDDSPTTPREPQPHSPNHRTWLQIPTLSRLQKNVLKCGLAYLISSLFTFVPYLSSFLADVPSNGKGEGGPSPSGHMVATVYVQVFPCRHAIYSLIGACILTLQ